MRHLSGLDASFLYCETPEVPMHTLKIGIFDLSGLPGPVTQADVMQEIACHVALIPALHKRVLPVPASLYHPVWWDVPELDLAAHLSFETIDGRADPGALDRVIARVAEGMLPRDRPLWHLTVVSGLDQGRVAAILKLHHAIADGGAAAAMLEAITTRTPARHDSLALPLPAHAPANLALLRSAVIHRARQFLHFPGLLARTLAGALRASRLGGRPRLLFSGPSLQVNGEVRRERLFLRFSFPLERFKALAKAADCSVNDLVYAAAGGAFRGYLLESGGDVSGPLVAAMPMAQGTVRHSFGNHVSNAFMPVPVHLESPAARIEQVRSHSLLAKEQDAARGDGMLAEWMEWATPLLQYFIWRIVVPRISRPPINLVLSNMPGPARPRFIGPARLAELYSVGPLMAGVGLNVTVWSYAGTMYFSILSTPLLSRAERLPRLFEDALCELERAYPEVP